MEVSGAAYLSALSIMLGSYGFFYGNYKGQIEAGFDVGIRAGDDEGRKRQVATVEKARSTLLFLGIVPLVVWLIFLGPVIEEVEAAFDVSFALAEYSAVDVAFVVVANAWLVIALLLFWQFKKLGGTLKELKK